MKIKTTKTLAKFLNNHEINKNYNYEIEKVSMTTNEFRYHVDFDIFRHEEDFDYTTGKMSVIVVYYKQDYYAMPKYLTTKDLLKIFRSSDRTADGFAKTFFENVEI